MEPVEYEGLWWVPDAPENKLHGKLIASGKDHIMLHLAGAFDKSLDLPCLFGERLKIVDLIHGTGEDGKPITLRDCMEGGNTTNMTSGYKRQSYQCRVAFVGKHYSDVESICSDNACFFFSHLKWWAQLRTITSFTIDQEKKGYGINHVCPEPLVGHTQFGKISIECGLSCNQQLFIGTTIKQEEYLLVENTPELLPDNATAFL